jgi:8-oxo-dGTP diphosphatase
MEIDKVALIHIKNKKVLFTLEKGKDKFYSAGGKREKGESDEETLIREIKEELSVDIDPKTIAYFGTFRGRHYEKPEISVKIACYTAKFFGKPKPSSEIERIAWLDSKDMEKVPPTGKLILKDLKKKGLID